ncbi:MAG: Serine phosphatase RsbU, regulator of sigma subunit [Parcubacteria group bacterium Gr01-1014_30]|nr:MAG: Serine phosphatase RsbU, regulator of sigma subunit [Parcubacteria group bacterium Gr01-1014_30]
MRRSVNFSVPIFTALLLFVAAPLLLFSSTYLFYQEAIKQLTAEGFWLEADLELVKEATLKIALWQGVAVFIVLTLVYLVLYLVWYAVILAPLRRLYKTILRVRQGDIEAKAEIRAKNEIGELANSFNEMVNELKKYQADLQETKQSLEIRVASRTRELQEIADTREETIKARTRDLQAKVDELERFHNLTVGRELKMIELKKEIAKLKEELLKNKPRP